METNLRNKDNQVITLKKEGNRVRLNISPLRRPQPTKLLDWKWVTNKSTCEVSVLAVAKKTGRSSAEDLQEDSR